MTNQLILSIVKEEKLLQWTRVEEAPPYSEIEVLRALDQLQAEARSEEHTSELQSRGHLVCSLLLGKKNKGDCGLYKYLYHSPMKVLNFRGIALTDRTAFPEASRREAGY